MEVTDLGTHFNVNAYEDEDNITTSLLEGSVKITSSGKTVRLKPGQQAHIDHERTINLIDQADVDAAVAWRDGYFQFSHADLKTVMRQLGRWYDIEIQFKGDIPGQQFGGKIQRSPAIIPTLKKP